MLNEIDDIIDSTNLSTSEKGMLSNNIRSFVYEQ